MAKLEHRLAGAWACRYAIAHAVLAYLTSHLDCRLMFATHYHALTREFAHNPRVRLAHMGALVHPHDSQQAITFLYRLMGGACPRSYGLEVRWPVLHAVLP